MQEKKAEDGGKYSPISHKPQDLSILRLPPAFRDSDSVENDLLEILGLGNSPQWAREQHILWSLDQLYPGGGVTQGSEAELAAKQLANWLSHQEIGGRILLSDPEMAATTLLSMTYGGLAAQRKLTGYLPIGAELSLYIVRAVRMFARGINRPS